MSAVELDPVLRRVMVRAVSKLDLPEGVEMPRFSFWVEDDKGRRWAIVCHYVPPPYLKVAP